MKLRFYARPGYMCSMPGPRVQGTAPRYVGRELKVEGKLITNPATREPMTLDTANRDGQRILRQMVADKAEHPLWPADRETAQMCQLPFVEVEYVGTEWQPKRATKTGKGEVS